MNEIPDLKNDVAFLKKFDSRINAWMEINEKKRGGTKKKIKSSFLLHPRRLHSDSECSSSVLTSPTKFISETVIKQSTLNEPNNNFQQTKLSYDMSCIEHRFINHDAELCLNRNTEKVKSNKAVCKAHPATIESSNITPSLPKKGRKISTSSSFVENFDKKYRALVEKSLKVLNNIRQTFEKGISAPDGEADYHRRLKRLQEFSSRFSRNYLYPLLRQVDELNSPEKPGISLDHKILNTQQLILNGLQAYYNYLPSSVEKCCSDKFKTLLDQVVSLCNVCDVQKDRKSETSEFIKALRIQTDLLIETVETFEIKFTEKILTANETEKKVVKKKGKQNDKKKSKLSMYATTASFRKDVEFKKAIEALAKKKYNVKSRYKTSGFKHRPPVEKPHIVQLPNKVQLYHKRSSTTIRSTPIRSPLREDEIITMVESDLAAPPNTGEILNHENNVASSERLAPDSDRENEEEDGNVKKALEVLKKFLGNCGQDQTQFLEKIASKMDKQKKKESDLKGQKSIKKLAPVTVTVTGAKNAKLICIRDDNPVVESEDGEKKDKEIMTEVETKQTSSETQTDLQQDQIRSRSTIKISRLPKSNRRPLKLLPKEYAIDIIQYKLRYAHFHKQNPMYRKSANVQPWILMGRISDDILDYILQSVTSELEVNEILENLYNAEFQY